LLFCFCHAAPHSTGLIDVADLLCKSSTVFAVFAIVAWESAATTCELAIVACVDV